MRGSRCEVGKGGAEKPRRGCEVGPWKVLLAAAAAKAMIDADGVTIVAYDSNI